MADGAPGGITIAALAHDFVRKRSIVTLVWDSDPEKRIALSVLFGCSFDGIRAEAEKALRSLSAEIGSIEVKEAE